MFEQPRSREEIYARIRETSKDQYILEEMVRLGFWGRADGMPEDPAEEVARRGELVRRLRALRTEASRLRNREALLKELRKRRMAESRRKRQETKERRLRERQERAEAWKARKSQEILFLGRGVSGGLGQTESRIEALEAAGLPVFSAPAELAAALEMSISDLRFLTYERPVSRTSHYVQFKIPKKAGGERLIAAPRPRLKAAQRCVLDQILSRLPATDAAHGFRRGRSIVSNARPHAGKDVVVNIDLKDFFPSLSYRRVKGMFQGLGYSESVATVLGLLCTAADTEPVTLDGERFHVATSERHLPQGAPSSPAITNQICRKLDNRLAGLAERFGFVFTRYADDITFSGSGEAAAKVKDLLRFARRIIGDEGFVVHPDKVRVLRRGRRQEVTGLTVNTRPAVERRKLRAFRATLFQVEKDGPDGKRWGQSDDVLAALQGFANYVFMVDPERGAPLRERVEALRRKHGHVPAGRPPRTAEPQATAQPAGEPTADAQKKGGKWYKLF